MSMKIIRTYRELSQLRTFEERYEYLKLSSIIGDKTFGFERYMNQEFYRSPEWKRVRREVILRDNGCDLGVDGREIVDRIEIHHITPISLEDFENGSPLLLDLNNLICTSPSTHKAIHYGESNLITPSEPTIRRLNDTCPWR